MTTTLCFLKRMIGYQYVCRKITNRVQDLRKKTEYIAEDGHVFRKIKTAKTMQSPRQST